jgi:hypothetical protein
MFSASNALAYRNNEYNEAVESCIVAAHEAEEQLFKLRWKKPTWADANSTCSKKKLDHFWNAKKT